MKQIIITTPARLHFGLIDMNGEIGRIDGGVGLTLQSPHTQIRAEKATGVDVECKSEQAIIERLKTALENVCNTFGVEGVHINVEERPLPHVGLGSASQTFLGAAHAICKLYDLDKHSNELAKLVNRGGTSGIGVEATEHGGFIVDGGHPFRRGKNGKHEYTPSAASTGIAPPPILARYDFPDWDILVVVPLGEGASGLREVMLFKVVCPIPIEEIRKMISTTSTFFK